MKRRAANGLQVLLMGALLTLPQQALALTVRTGDIVDGAVTTAKIANQAVTSGKMAPGAVTTASIADGAVTAAKISGVVPAEKLGPHAHNAGDIVGTIPAGQLPVGTAADTVASGDHNHDAIYQKKYANVAIVAKGGGDYADPVAAMDNLAAWCGTPSASNPCLVKIMPGVYNIGNNRVQMQSFVDIEGSGEKVTKVTGSIGFGPDNWWCGTINPVSDSELRSLTVENTSEALNTLTNAIYVKSGAPKITNVTAIGANTNMGVGVLNYMGSAVLESVTATGGNSSVYIYFGSPILRNVHATGGYNSMITIGQVGDRTIVENSVVDQLYVYQQEGKTLIANSRIDRVKKDYYSGTGITKCVNVYNSNFEPVVCQ